MGRSASFAARFVVVAAAASLAACGGSSPPETGGETASFADVVGPRWVLSRLGSGEPLPAGVVIDAVFEAERISGSAGCNRYFASVESDDSGSFRIGPIGATRRMCPPPVMDAETRYLAALGSASAWRLAPGRLELDSRQTQGDDVIVFVREPE